MADELIGTDKNGNPVGAAVDETSGDIVQLQMSAGTHNLKVVDSGAATSGVVTALGTLNTSVVDQLLNYKLADYEIGATYIYVGKLRKDGAWFLMRITRSTGNTLYSAAASGYTWANRASPTPAYASFDSIF